MADLADFLRASAARPFVWGECDCALWAVAWIRLVHGDIADPAAHLRGRYHTRIGCHRVLIRGGGLLQIARGIAQTIELPPVTEPQRGDVVCLDIKEFKALGIAAGNGRIAMKAQAGITVSPMPVLAAWRV